MHDYFFRKQLPQGKEGKIIQNRIIFPSSYIINTRADKLYPVYVACCQNKDLLIASTEKYRTYMGYG